MIRKGSKEFSLLPFREVWACAHVKCSRWERLFGFGELVLADAAQGALVIVGQVVEGYALGCLVVLITANIAYVFHNISPFIVFLQNRLRRACTAGR